MTSECKQQFTLRITQANSTEMVVILYEMLICYLDEAKEALQPEDSAAFKEAVRKANSCLNELIQSLNLEYEPAPRLFQLYMYCAKKLARARVLIHEQELEQVRAVIEPLQDAYRQIAPLNHDGPVMGNSQTVYAGLTYGRNTLTENMADQGANRGLRV